MVFALTGCRSGVAFTCIGIVAESDEVAVHVSTIGGKRRPRFDRMSLRLELCFPASKLGRRHAKREQKRASVRPFDPTRGLVRVLDHQDRAAEVQPDGSQPTIAGVMPGNLAQSDEIPIKRCEPLHIRASDGKVVQRGMNPLPIVRSNLSSGIHVTSIMRVFAGCSALLAEGGSPAAPAVRRRAFSDLVRAPERSAARARHA